MGSRETSVGSLYDFFMPLGLHSRSSDSLGQIRRICRIRFFDWTFRWPRATLLWVSGTPIALVPPLFSVRRSQTSWRKLHVERTSQLLGADIRRAGRTEHQGQRAAQESRGEPQTSGRTAEVSDRREAHQGCDTVFQR